MIENEYFSYIHSPIHISTCSVLSSILPLYTSMMNYSNKVWPWKETLTTYLDKHGVETPLTQRNILPAMDGSLVIALLLIAVGIILVIGLEKVADRKNKAAA